MTQTEFIEALLRRFKLEHTQACATPRKTNETIKKTVSKARVRTKLKLKKKIPFRQLVGALLYIANSTRPEISFAVNKLCQKQSNFTLDDWIDAERVLRYLGSTKELGLSYTGQNSGLVVYSDASLGKKDPKGHAMAGHIVKLFGDSVIWCTNKQKVVATSTMEAEYLEMSRAAKAVVTIKNIIEKLTDWKLEPILFGDNSSAIKNTQAEHCKKLMHLVSLHFHFVR